MTASKALVRVAAIGDVHYGKNSQGALQGLFSRLNDAADVLLICGDLTDYGLTEEARILAKDVASYLRVPVVAVLGNHDFEAGKQEEIAQVMHDVGVSLLDGDTCEVHGIGFAGVKGFAGGFGRGALGPWGEDIVKRFVREAVDEALKLESALARLRNPARVALLHYAPVRGTVEGEPLEIFPYLGCSRLEEPLTHYPVTAVFHGHAHHGTHEAHTTAGIPVFNVSLPLMRELNPEMPVRIVEVDTSPLEIAEATTPAHA
jgi:Icc-related predicted phosphoesterase